MGTWNWLDWTLAVVLTVSIVSAIFKGFVRELISVASVVAGLVIAALGYRWAAAGFEDLSRSREIALGLGFLTLFLGSLVLGALVSVLARKLVKTAGLQWFDRFLGGIFGLIRGVVVDCVLLMALVSFGIKTNAVQQSLLAPYVTTGARVIALAMPQEVQAHFGTGFEKFKQALIEADKKAAKN